MAKKSREKTEPAATKAKKGKEESSIPKGKKGKVEETNDKKKGQDEEERDPSKPRRGRAIGDNFGWTGKLPVTLLFEHCQKQKWGKVDFQMNNKGGKFLATAVLQWTNPKTKENIRLPMIADAALAKPAENTNEARHYAATYALHCINFIKNMKMVLPQIFGDYWAQLERERVQLQKENLNRYKTIYNANPFTAYLERRDTREQNEKKRLVQELNNEKIRKPMISISSNTSSKPRPAEQNNTREVLKVKPSDLKVEQTPTFPRKVWDKAPFVDFPSDLRMSIETSIKKHINWIFEDSDESLEASISEDSTKRFLALLVLFGFRESHVKESFKYTSTFIDALEWLLFHLPEDDLPHVFAKTDKDSGVSLKISKNVKQEYLLKRVGQSGFDEDEILAALQDNDFNEIQTCVSLTHKLAEYEPDSQIEDETSSQDLWEQEIEGIEILGSNVVDFVPGSENKIVNILLNAEKLEKGLFTLRLFKSTNYPLELPGLQIIVNKTSHKLANYIKLSIIGHVSKYIISNGFIGDCFIFSIVEWLDTNIAKIINNPGPLITDEIFKETVTSEGVTTTKRQKSKRRGKSLVLLGSDIERLKKEYSQSLKTKDMLSSIKQRTTLPAWRKKDQLVSIINSNKVTLVTGETGSGKSTQIVQFMLDHMNTNGNFSSKIICTQPRRISTIGLAERISSERVNIVGKEVGYIIRGENKTTQNTRISFVTTGVLLRMLQSFLTSNDLDDGIFDNLEYIFIDEVHERSVDSDFLLIILKRVIKKFPKLKIILMSATINIETFRNFFDTPLNHIHIEGRTFPIEDYYLDTILEETNFTIKNPNNEIVQARPDSHYFKSGTIDYNLIAHLCLHVHEKLESENNSGSILVFLPGIMEISRCIKYISYAFSDENINCWPLPLHSALSSAEQKKVFQIKKGTRKIVVSTNVAETSITIPDCVAVIDSGRSKTLFYDSSMNTTKLIEDWCSKAEIGQRRGRSGRITDGNCYHLYTKQTENEMKPQPIPEIKRTRLENLYLIVKAMGIDQVEEFLNGGLDAPDQSSLMKSKKFLEDIGALEHGHLSNLGKYLSFIPTDLLSGKLLILGCIFGCVDTCLTLAALGSSGSPFLNNMEQRDKIKQIKDNFGNGNGDFIAMANAYSEYQKVKETGKNANKFLSDNFLSYLTMNDISSTRIQYISIMKELGFVPYNFNLKNNSNDVLNRNNDNFSVIRAIITGSYYPQIARAQLPDPKYFKSLVGAVSIDPDAKQTKYWLRNEDYNQNTENSYPATRGFIHPSSILFATQEQESSLTREILEKVTNEDGDIDYEKARKLYDLNPQAPKAANPALKSSFIVYRSSHLTNKLYVRDVTPTSTLATLLFGGEFSYNLINYIERGQSSPGIVLDNWMPIRTWCKNGVLIKRLRKLLDGLIEEKLSKPNQQVSTNEDILSIVEKLLSL